MTTDIREFVLEHEMQNGSCQGKQVTPKQSRVINRIKQKEKNQLEAHAERLALLLPP